MRTFFVFSLSAALFVAALGCQTTSTPNSVSPNGGEEGIHATLSREDQVALETRRQEFVTAPDFVERLRRLLELEQQALQLAVDEPLKLGSIGSAILDIYPGSQTGHYAMSRFYAYVESPSAQAVHDNELARIHADMVANGNGTTDAPYPVMTIYDAHAYAKINNTTPVGSLYQATVLDNFGLLLVTRPEKGSLKQLHFDLHLLLVGFAHDTAPANDGNAPADDDHPSAGNPWSLMQFLAARMDTAAQAAIGRYLSTIQKYDDAIGWLRVASRSDNVLANALLARIYLAQAEASDDEAKRQELRELALENHLHAIALGSTDSMYTLANLYINDFYGEDNRAAAIPLLRQAGELGHADALLYLGYLHNAGREVKQSPEIAADYFAQAAALNNTQAIINYGRFIATEAAGEHLTDANRAQAITWLENLTDNPEAMVVLGNLHAKGIGTRTSTSRAVRWYKKAVKVDPVDADIVNEVAWTLTVTDVQGLKRAKYAKQIMDHMMDNNEQAKARPEYLDTWAAAHAASGDFAEAIRLQEQAIAIATATDRADVIEILKGHLNLFKSGATITEQAP